MPPLHTGIHTGPAIYRAGDYIGATVNVASRVTSEAAAGETLMTESVGARTLRGVERPVPLFRLLRE
jgi:class 3 adenylate cyclase